jgi:Ca-activated chloride channel homolog
LQLTTVSPDHYATYEPYDLTVFHAWLPEAWPRGGVLVVAPPAGGLLNAQVATTVNALPAFLTGGLLADLDLSHVDFGRAAVLEAPDWLTPVLTDELGLTLIWHGATEGTRLVAFAFGLDRGNLARRTAFPVLIANAVAEVVPPPLPEAVGVGQAVELPPPHMLPFLTITDPAGAQHNFTGSRSPLFTETFDPGLYLLRGQTINGQVWEGGFGVNAGSARESDLRVSAQPALTSMAVAGAPPPRPGNPPWQLWPWFVLAVLGVMVLEAWLSWR